MASDPGELIGRGRAADIYALDAGRVLRRYRTPHPCEAEAGLMRYLRQAGYPVAEIRLRDVNVRPAEAARLRRLARTASPDA